MMPLGKRAWPSNEVVEGEVGGVLIKTTFDFLVVLHARFEVENRMDLPYLFVDKRCVIQFLPLLSPH